MHFSMVELWQAMGPLAKGVVLVLLGMSLMSMTVAVAKWLTLRRAARESGRFLRVWREAVDSLRRAVNVDFKLTEAWPAQIADFQRYTRERQRERGGGRAPEIGRRGVAPQFPLMTCGPWGCG